MSRSVRRIVAALSVAIFLAPAGDGLMAAVCPPDEHLELHEDVSRDAAGDSSQETGEDHHGNPAEHDHGDEAHCCPAASSNASACAGAVADVDDSVDRLTPPAPQDTGPRLDDDLPLDPFLSGTFRPPCA